MKISKSLLALSCGMIPYTSSAITVVVDYSLTSSSLFNAGTADGLAARAAVNQAAADISYAITTELAALSAGSGGWYEFEGVNGISTVTYQAKFTYDNPDTRVSTDYFDALAANEFKVFAGGSSLSDSTAGQGGSGYANQLGIVATEAEAQGASDAGSSLASTALERGGPVLNNISGNFDSPFETITHSTNFGAGVGFLSMDSDGSTDWHFDHTIDVASGKLDFYSVALHEILHAIGYGASHAWDSNISGTSWLGAEAIAANGGSGANLVDADEGHIDGGVTSTRISDGESQQAVMAASLSTGERLTLTEIDLAILRDMGYQTVPEPSSVSLLGFGLLSVMMRRRR